MQRDKLNDIRINNETLLTTPAELKAQLPLSEDWQQQIACSREIVSAIVNRHDHRLLVVCGPCSIHDTAAALEYADKLAALSAQLKDHLYIVMRVYFEKPRTTVGWKGLINDPDMDGSFNIEKGLYTARKLLLDLTAKGLPLATEALDPNNPQYIGALFSWAAIGARTTESQTHREMASGLSVPVGFKNSTDGSLETAINAMKAAAMPHRFVGINHNGQVAVLQTEGNPDGHLILRGGSQPNYAAEHVQACEQQMESMGLNPAIMIDCSHGNSNKDYRRQSEVIDSVVNQIQAGNRSIIGVMLESNLHEGNQSSEQPFASMRYGVSVTDACIGWEVTEEVLHRLHDQLQNPLLQRGRGN